MLVVRMLLSLSKNERILLEDSVCKPRGFALVMAREELFGVVCVSISGPCSGVLVFLRFLRLPSSEALVVTDVKASMSYVSPFAHPGKFTATYQAAV